MQFEAQLKHYRTTFPQAEHHIILWDNQPIGRIYVSRSDEEIRLLDITLAPGRRNAGVGSYCMRRLMTDAATTEKPIRFYVWQLNYGALRWYRRLGFSETGGEGPYISMEWRPDTRRSSI